MRRAGTGRPRAGADRRPACSGRSPTSRAARDARRALLPASARARGRSAARDDLRDGLAPVQRRVRVLEDDLHPRRSAPQLARGERAKSRCRRSGPCRRSAGQPEQQPRERRLAGAGLADEPERLAAPEGERDVVDRADHRPRRAAAEPKWRRGPRTTSGVAPAQTPSRAGPSTRHAAAPRRGKWHSSRGSPTGTGGGTLVDAARPRVGAARMERAAGRERLGERRLARDRGDRPRRRRGRAADRLSSASVYGCAGARSTASAAPLSTIRPAYMTCDVVAEAAATPRSCVISITPSGAPRRGGRAAP